VAIACCFSRTSRAPRQRPAEFPGLGAARLDDLFLDGLDQPRPAAMRLAAVPSIERQAVDAVIGKGRLGHAFDGIDQLFGLEPQPRLVLDVLAGGGIGRPKDHDAGKLADLALKLFLPIDATHVLVPPDDDAKGAQPTDDLFGERAITARIGQKDARHFCSFDGYAGTGYGKFR